MSLSSSYPHRGCGGLFFWSSRHCGPAQLSSVCAFPALSPGDQRRQTFLHLCSLFASGCLWHRAWAFLHPHQRGCMRRSAAFPPGPNRPWGFIPGPKRTLPPHPVLRHRVQAHSPGGLQDPSGGPLFCHSNRTSLLERQGSQQWLRELFGDMWLAPLPLVCFQIHSQNAREAMKAKERVALSPCLCGGVGRIGLSLLLCFSGRKLPVA